MKDIKFRAWHKDKKEFCKVVNINPERKVAKLDYEWPEGKRFVLLKNIILMQYTGIKDKNGAEVYEGDIMLNECTIEQPGHLLTTKTIGDIQILNGMTYLVGKQWQYTDEEDFKVKLSDYKCLMLNRDLFKVIGNIYRNPEIVKEV